MTAERIPGLDPDALLMRMRSIFGDDRDGLRDIVLMFLADVPAEIEALDAAIAVADVPVVISRAHSLKGMLRNFGLGPLGDLFQDIEDQCRQGEIVAAAALSREARVGLEAVCAVLREQLDGDLG
jgi:HPt (histidine-containing phosphotransfer) domain-containing protein